MRQDSEMLRRELLALPKAREGLPLQTQDRANRLRWSLRQYHDGFCQLWWVRCDLQRPGRVLLQQPMPRAVSGWSASQTRDHFLLWVSVRTAGIDQAGGIAE